jgi:hypothetical protein
VRARMPEHLYHQDKTWIEYCSVAKECHN